MDKKLNKNNEILKYTGLVVKMADKYAILPSIREDLISAGFLGLLVAKNKFKKKKNVSFSTYATYWIKKYILKTLDEYYNKTFKHDSLDIKDTDTDGFYEHYILSRKDDFSEKIKNSILTEKIFERMKEVGKKKKVRWNIDECIDILKMYFGFYDGIEYSMSEIAKKLGCSRQQISCRIKNAIKFLREEVLYGKDES